MDMAQLERKVAEQLAEWDPQNIKIDIQKRRVDFTRGHTAYYASLTPKCTGVKRGSVRVDLYS